MENLRSLIEKHSDLIQTTLAITGAIVAIAVFAWTRGRLLLRWAIERGTHRPRSRVISKIEDPAFDEFVELYHSAFSLDERVSTKEIQDWLRFKARSLGIEYRLHLCWLRSVPAGFCITMYCPKQAVVFIPYLGVAQMDERWRDTRRVVRSLLQSLSKTYPHWRILVAEVESPDEEDLPHDERRRRMARVRRLRALAGSVGLEIREPNFLYTQPAYATDAADQHDRVMSLLVFSSAADHVGIPKRELLDCLETLYLSVYLPCYAGDRVALEAYACSLHSHLSRYAATLPDPVPFRPR